MKRAVWGIVLAVILTASFSAVTYAETAVSVDDFIAFINGEAGEDGKISLYEILQLFAEEDAAPTDVPDTEGPAGYLSEDDLIQAYIDCLNGVISFDEFYNSFDRTGYMAYWVSENYGRITVEEAYDVFSDADKGTAYVIETYQDFCQKWNDFTGGTFSEDALNTLIAEYSVDDELLYQDFESFIQKLSDTFGPFDDAVQAEYIWNSEYGYNTYTIAVDDPEDFIQSISVIYIEQDGKYYWVMLKQTA